MAPLTWRNVDAPDLSRASEILNRSASMFGGAMGDLGSNLQAVRERQRRDRSAEALPMLARVASESGVDPALDQLSQMISANDMTPQLQQAMMNLRGMGLGFDESRANLDYTKARTALTNTQRANVGSGSGNKERVFNERMSSLLDNISSRYGDQGDEGGETVSTQGAGEPVAAAVEPEKELLQAANPNLAFPPKRDEAAQSAADAVQYDEPEPEPADFGIGPSRRPTYSFEPVADTGPVSDGSVAPASAYAGFVAKAQQGIRPTEQEFIAAVESGELSSQEAADVEAMMGGFVPQAADINAAEASGSVAMPTYPRKPLGPVPAAIQDYALGLMGESRGDKERREERRQTQQSAYDASVQAALDRASQSGDEYAAYEDEMGGDLTPPGQPSPEEQLARDARGPSSEAPDAQKQAEERAALEEQARMPPAPIKFDVNRIRAEAEAVASQTGDPNKANAAAELEARRQVQAHVRQVIREGGDFRDRLLDPRSGLGNYMDIIDEELAREQARNPDAFNIKPALDPQDAAVISSAETRLASFEARKVARLPERYRKAESVDEILADIQKNEGIPVHNDDVKRMIGDVADELGIEDRRIIAAIISKGYNKGFLWRSGSIEKGWLKDAAAAHMTAQGMESAGAAAETYGILSSRLSNVRDRLGKVEGQIQAGGGEAVLKSLKVDRGLLQAELQALAERISELDKKK